MLHPSKILSTHGLAAQKKFGQNFLTSDAPLIFLDGFLKNDEAVLEIGPGLGCISEYILKRHENFFAIEKDQGLYSYLKDNVIDSSRLWQGDFLTLDKNFLEEKKIRLIVGNLPFYITTPIIEKIVKELPFVHSALLGVQYEYAQRVCQKTGNSLSIFLQASGEVSYIKKIDRKSYFPVPNVDTAWFLWRRKKEISAELEKFETLLRMCFWAKRKNLENNLRKNPTLPLAKTDMLRLKEQAGLLLTKRPDALNIEEYIFLYNIVF